jgi:hypothetical protein
MLRRLQLAIAILPVLCLLTQINAEAQTPVALPYTMTTIAGQSPMAATAGTQCPGLPTGVKSTDAYGDGCLAVNGIFGAAPYGGVLVDSNGMIYVVDDTDKVIHQINPATGIMTLVAGGGSLCGSALDYSGDGCPAATGTVLVTDRAAGIDYYGNPMWGAYTSHVLHMVCINASPICVSGTPAPTAANPLQIQIGYMGYVAGCATGSSASAGSSGIGLDNKPGFTTKTNAVAAFQNGGSCSTSLGETDRPESYSGDVYGNIYYYESVTGRYRVVLGPQTSTYFSGNNPLYAALTQTGSPWATVTAGYAYTIVGLGAATTQGLTTGCNGGGTATDAFGDGCLFNSAEVGGLLAYQAGIGVDAAGNMVYTDNTRGLRVFYVSDGTNFTAGTPGYIAGQKMKAAIIANIKGYIGWTSVTAPPTGFNYMLAGGGATAIGSATPATLGSALSFTADNKMYRLTVSPQGNIYIGDINAPQRVYFFDINTGYLRVLFTSASSNIAKGTTCGAGTGLTSLSAFSDGCPASKSQFTDGSTLSVGVDPQGDLYMFDGTNNVVRKVLAQGFTPQTYNTTPASQTQTFQVHLPESASVGTITGASATVTSSPDITVASGTNPTTPSCTQNGDNTVDCTVQVTTAPTQVGQRSAALTVTLPTGTWENASATINLSQIETGSVMVVDSATMGGVAFTSGPYPAIFSSITPTAVAVDGAGNLYAANGTSIQEAFNGSSWTYSTLPNTLPDTPSQIAVDPNGNIFAVNSASPTIAELALAAAGAPATYTTTSVSYTPSSGTATPQAVAVDRFGNLYVADYQSGGSSVYRLSWSPLSQKYQNQVTVVSGLVNPVSLAVAPSGNVFVADKSAGDVYEYSPSSASLYALANTYSLTSPDAVAVDAGGDLYVQSSSDIYEIPVSPLSTETVVYTGLSNPTGLAVDGLGNVYSADASNASITQITRNNLTCNFGTEASAGLATCSGTVTNAGNQVTTGSSLPANNFSFSGCGVSANEMEALSAGESCVLSVTMAGGPLADYSLTFLPAASSVGSLTLEGTVALPTYSSTTAIAGPAETTPTYAPSGTEATFTVTVAPSASSGYSGANSPTGTPLAWVCSGSTACPYSAAYAKFTPSGLSEVGSTTSSSSTVLVSGLAAGTYNINATFSGDTTFNPSSTSSGTSFTIAQVSTAVSGWTPSATTQQVSAVIGTGVLNATATPSGLAGNFVYTATCTSGSCSQFSNTTIDASTYLPIGTYSLGVTFVPTDLTDYIPSTGPTVSYTVTQATTTAAVGASTNVVAADGSGNYTSLSAALAALPMTGGTIYLKPGTYTGQNAISYPNVFLRGLGGDPTKVILTGENGNFALGAYPQSSGTAFGSGPAGKAGDEGSATLDVSKNGYMGTTVASGSYSPAGFYAEYLTIQNTYDTDPVTTSTTTASSNGGTCNFSGATPNTLQYLYNNNLECGSQAQALFMNADQAILNNVNLISQQDTLYAGYQGTAGSTYVPSRQYIWQGMITGDVDFIYGDSALVMDHTNIFTTLHGLTAGAGTETITAQNKRVQTGSSNDYLSGYVCNVCTLMSQGTGMTKLYYGRPYGVYSTFVLLNSQVDQVNPGGWIGWDGASEYLSTSTYAEYNTQAYTDPAVGTPPYPSILFYPTTAAGGVIPTGGNSGYGTTAGSTPPASLETSALQLTAAQATPYYPLNFLSTAVSTTGGYSGMPTTWNPVTALTAAVNSFAPTGTGSLNLGLYGNSVTILGRPVTPGAGIVPTGAYTFMDSLNGGTATTLASGTLDASGEAYLTTSTLAAGTHSITMTYGGDANFSASSSSSTFTINIQSIGTATSLSVTNPSSTYGGTITGTVSVSPTSGTGTPTGTVTLTSGLVTLGSCTLSGGSCTYSLTGVAAGNNQTMVANYSGDPANAPSTSSGMPFSVAQASLQVAANNASMLIGGALPGFTYSITGFLNGDTQTSAVTGSPSLATSATGTVVGNFPITISIGTLAAMNYQFTFVNATLSVLAPQAAAVATGDSRSVNEPAFPATVCAQLTATLASVNNDIPSSVDATVSNPDGARIQAALNSCANSGNAVELSVDGSGNNAFLTGPLTMPANVTLLVDPGVTVYFSRNVQDYDKTPGTHTCGTINGNTATNSCLPLIDIPKTSTNVGIMGFGKLNGRGGDPLLNGFATGGYAAPSSYTWWNLAAQANNDSGGNQQNPRFIQLESGGSNLTLYKITLLNAPMFHISTTGSYSGFTAWDVKIVTPTSSRNTDGIDPGNAQNFTITQSWISDGDDNVAVGASGSAPAKNISVTNNHFFAGHGESIGSYTGAGVSNVLFDGNMLWGNASSDSNSTGIRIKSANDRGGVVTNIQYSNSCFQGHRTEIQFTPLYNSNTGTSTPNFKNILLQNLTFLTAGTVQFTGADNTTPVPAVINPLQATLDNVSFPNTFPSYEFVNSGNEGTETNAQLTFGPGDVSTSFVNDWATFAGSNGNTVTNNIVVPSLYPPTCNFTAIAPELTGPTGLPQTINSGQNAAAVVILTPAVGGAAYPTGTVTLTDALTSNSTTVTLPGNTDTVSIPLSGLTVGTHTFTATYSGDSNYPLPNGQTVYTTTAPYAITVNASSLAATTTTLSGVPSSATYGSVITATATVAGSNPTGTVQFIVNGAVYVSVALTASGTASASINLPVNSNPYSIYAIYGGDTINAGSTSSTSSLQITQATPTINWSNPATITYGTPLSATQLNATSTTAGTLTYTPASGTVLKAGQNQTLSVTLTPTDTTDYTTATATVTINVNQATPTISWSNPATITYGTALSATQLNATSATPGTLAYTPASGTVLQAGQNQTLSVTLTPTDSIDYAPATATVTINVNQATPTIAWSNPAAITYGTALSATQLNATSTTAGTLTYTPASGTVLKAGQNQTLSVTLTPTDSTDYTTATATVTISVNQVTPTISWSNPAAISYGTALSATQLNATSATPGTLTYNPASGTVLKAGQNQTLSVTLTPTDTTDYTTATATVTINVSQVTPTISWSNPAAINYGTALSATQLNATSATPGTLTYTPASGTVLKAGQNQTLSVTLTPTDTTDYTTATATVTINVNQVTPTINWSSPAAITYGTALSATQLNATSTTAGTLTYTPASGTVLKAGQNQTLSVTLTPTDTTDYTTATATVTINVNQAAPTISWSSPAAITYGTALSAAQLDATSATPGTLTYTPASGTVLKAGQNQTLSVTLTPTDTTDYAPATTAVTINVNQVNPTINWSNPATITYGTALSATQLNATSTTPGTLTYAPATGTVLKAGQGQTLSVTLTPTDTTDYATATATVTINVNQATPTINWSNPAAITYGTALSATQLNATSTTPGTLTYTPAAGTVLKLGQNQTLSVTLTPTDTTDYATATATVTINVNQVTPTINWSNPTAITYGTALSATQLNATSATPGTLTYTPALGTVLKAGQGQTLSVTLTPTDTTDYATATATVTINVNQATPTVTLMSSLNPALAQNSITFTATVASIAGSPTGTVTFLDGATPLGTGTLNSGGVATLTTSNLSAGSHSITAAYGGDTNFTAVTSGVISEGVTDFSLAISGNATGTAKAGVPAVFAFTVNAVGSTVLPSAVTLTATGLPTDTTATFSPAVLTAGTASDSVTLTVQLARIIAANTQRVGPRMTGSKLPLMALTLLLLPLARRMRHAGKNLRNMVPTLLLLLMGLAAVAGMSGCGGSSHKSVSPGTYQIQVTGTSGSLSHSVQVTLTVE